MCEKNYKTKKGREKTKAAKKYLFEFQQVKRIKKKNHVSIFVKNENLVDFHFVSLISSKYIFSSFNSYACSFHRSNFEFTTCTTLLFN